MKSERYEQMANRYLVRIWLSCGCTIRGRQRPLTKTMKFSCTTGLGHGSRNHWLRWAEGELEFNNPLHSQRDETEMGRT